MTARADCQSTLKDCDAAVTECGNALEKRKAELQLSDLALKQSTQENVDFLNRAEEAESELHAWYRSPFLFMALGLAGGFFLAK